MQHENQNSVLFAYLQAMTQWWKGFNEQDNSRLPTAHEKRQMLRYPIINSNVQLVTLPLVSANYSVIGDEKQKIFVEHWIRRYYRRIISLMAEKAVGWGMSVGERVMDIEQIDGKDYWIQKNVIAPPPSDCTLTFSDKKPAINGFTYSQYTVNRFDEQGKTNFPGMVYYAFKGNEVSKPYGWSLLNDLYWPWQLVMKEWSSWVVYKRMKVPVWLLYYPPEKVKSGTSRTDLAKASAEQMLENLKNAGGAALPLQRIVEQGVEKFVKGHELTSADIDDREPGYRESIRILNSMMYICALIPERLMEQFRDTGSQSMVSTQKDFYTENVLVPRIDELQEYITEWFINPMLEANFGKVDCEVDLSPLDRLAELYIEIVRDGVKAGSQGPVPGLIDWRELIQRIGLPIDPDVIEPTAIEAEKKTTMPSAEFETRKEQKEKAKKYVEGWVKNMDHNVRVIEEKVYDILKKELLTEQGKVGLAVAKLYETPDPKPEDIAKVVQLPRRLFGQLWDHVLDAWDAGMRPVIEEAKKRTATPYMSAPSKPVENELWALTLEMEGFERNNAQIAGEGELLERRLFAALRFGANSREEALKIVNENFNKYIEQNLPNRLINLFHQAVNLGAKDAMQYLQIRDLEKKKG